MTADVTALREILPQLEQAGDRLEDECLGQLVAAFHGIDLQKVSRDPNNFLEIRSGHPRGIVWYSPRSRCPDMDLSAADNLVSELLPGWSRTSSSEGWCKLEDPHRRHAKVTGVHAKTESLAILITLAKAIIAEKKEDG